jgi:hypothetical protein
VVERVKTKGLPLPTLSDAATKPVFERMVNVDNIPLRVGLNRTLSVTIAFRDWTAPCQRFTSSRSFIRVRRKTGNPNASELASLMVYEAKISAALLDLSEPYLATLAGDKKYQVHVDYLDQVKSGARQFYSGLVQGMTETRLYSKPDILQMIGGALAVLPAYHPILTDQDRQDSHTEAYATDLGHDRSAAENRPDRAARYDQESPHPNVRHSDAAGWRPPTFRGS